MVRTRPVLPAGHGEVLARPAVSEWAGLLAANRATAETWEFSVAGVPVAALRLQARTELLGLADEFSARIGVPIASPGAPRDPIVMTGHQPDLYHPGVWVKDFLLQRLGEEVGATAIDVVVDSDGFDVIALSAPCMRPDVARCRQYLAVSGAGAAFATTPMPSARDLEDFCRAASQMLASLPAPALNRHFSSFCDKLREASGSARTLAELITFARRRYEHSAGTDYLEAPVTTIARTESYARFVVDLALDARRFAAAYNDELDEYRALTKTRSAAQPFPNLATDGELTELPLWLLGDRGREPVFVRSTAGGVELATEQRTLLALTDDADQAVRTLLESGLLLPPKAVALTLFTRAFASDLFIHGVGGGRYDRITDGVIRRFYGVEPPAFVVASMTMYLPLGAHIVTDEEVAAAKERLNRLEHNPDALLAEVDFDSPDERARAIALASEKTTLVSAIAQPDADKKTIGQRIRQVNAELATVLAPLKAVYEAELGALVVQHEASAVLTDRTYPFCLWAPEEIADKVR